jgi:hypothetical protein
MICRITLVSRRFATVLIATGLMTGSAALVRAGTQSADQHCWQRPGPETIEETLLLSGKDRRRVQADLEDRAPSPNVLLLSDGFINLAYGAGLIVGWGETGERPRFAVITAVGASALIAPFAFIGLDGDPIIADIFNCPSQSLDDLAERAASLIDTTMLAAIAREHRAGRRLLIALQRSPARPAAVWDVGLLATKGNAETLTIVRTILRASIGPYLSADTNGVLKEARTLLPDLPTTRQIKSGREFLLPAGVTPIGDARTRYFLIHNDPFTLSQNTGGAVSRKRNTASADQALALLSGDEAVGQVVATGSRFGFAAPKSRGMLGLFAKPDFDHAYLLATFVKLSAMDAWARNGPLDPSTRSSTERVSIRNHMIL